MPALQQRLVALGLLLDRETARVVPALEDAGVQCVLLKGSALAQWLYPDEFRPYGDIDLLVDPAQQQIAISVLGRLGYHDPLPGLSSAEVSLHARTLRGPHGSVVDLHTRLNNTGVDDSRVWQVLSAQTRAGEVAGQRVRMCNPVAQTLVVALHAAQHGRLEPKPLEDLRRAALTLTDRDLEAVAAMADELGAQGSFAAALTMLPELGQRLATFGDVPLGSVIRVQAAGLHAQPGLLLFAGLREQSWPQRIRAVARAVWPSTDFLRSRTSPARIGRPGWTLRARCSRWGYQLKHLSGALARSYHLHRDQ